ncbi:MAG: hypothetical protein IPJ38_05605 [Dechloromonas sp.]|uniref:DUF5082 domain-containing protein n=1 Tax=Candidatus Dechloromonas phosphorivorans TaxID=2899244 RepID=A0A935JY30_9RHOO|nr:hypothetical protein [Candidatus Dechloromonas phosphorivorans]
MNFENTKAELDRYIEGMNCAAELEVASINARCSEIKQQMDILAEKRKQLADEVQQGRDGGVSDINSRCAEIMSRGMSYEELARYAAEGWSWSSYNEDAYDKLSRNLSIVNEGFNLSRELEQLDRRRDVLISSFDGIEQKIGRIADVLEAKCETYEVMKEKAKAPRSTGGKNRDKNTNFQKSERPLKLHGKHGQTNRCTVQKQPLHTR